MGDGLGGDARRSAWPPRRNSFAVVLVHVGYKPSTERSRIIDPMSFPDFLQPAPVFGPTIAAIPAIRISRPRLGIWRVAAGARVSGPASLAGIMGRFVEDVAADSGIVFEVGYQRAGPAAA